MQKEKWSMRLPNKMPRKLLKPLQPLRRGKRLLKHQKLRKRSKKLNRDTRPWLKLEFSKSIKLLRRTRTFSNLLPRWTPTSVSTIASTNTECSTHLMITSGTTPMTLRSSLKTSLLRSTLSSPRVVANADPSIYTLSTTRLGWMILTPVARKSWYSIHTRESQASSSKVTTRLPNAGICPSSCSIRERNLSSTAQPTSPTEVLKSTQMLTMASRCLKTLLSPSRWKWWTARLQLILKTSIRQTQIIMSHLWKREWNLVKKALRELLHQDSRSCKEPTHTIGLES